MQYGRLLAAAALAGVVIVGRAGLAAPNAAAATVHLQLKRSVPAKDTTTTAAPSTIRLWFTERAEPAVARVSLKAADGKPVAVSAVRRETAAADTSLVVDVKGAMNPGRYTVGWRVMSGDGHPVTGEFGFTISPPTNPDN